MQTVALHFLLDLIAACEQKPCQKARYCFNFMQARATHASEYSMLSIVTHMTKWYLPNAVPSDDCSASMRWPFRPDELRCREFSCCRSLSLGGGANSDDSLLDCFWKPLGVEGPAAG